MGFWPDEVFYCMLRMLRKEQGTFEVSLSEAFCNGVYRVLGQRSVAVSGFRICGRQHPQGPDRYRHSRSGTDPDGQYKAEYLDGLS